MQTKPNLSVVGAPTTVSQRVRALQAEARGLAAEHVQALIIVMAEAERLALEIADGGDAYPAGVRDIARRLAEDTGLKIGTIQAIGARV